MANHNTLANKLIDEYRSAFESSTILALVSDYDLTDPTQIEAARIILDFVKESPVDFTGDSNTSNNSDTYSSANNYENVARENMGSKSQEGRSTEIDPSLQSPDSLNVNLIALGSSISDMNILNDEGPPGTHIHALNGPNEKGKVEQLMEMFPTLNAYDIKHVIKKYNEDLSLVVDELMTQSFLEETGDQCRSIDGFASSANTFRQRKRKGKKKGGQNDIGLTKTSTFPSPPRVKGSVDVSQQNIEFLAEKVGLPKSQISALYDESGASLSKTISCLIEAQIRADIITENDQNIQDRALQLYKDFPMISMEHLRILCQIAYPHPSNARKLAKALISPISSTPDNIELTIQYARPNVGPETAFHKVKAPPVHSSKPSEPEIAVAKAASLREARNAAFAKATAAYRRGKSDHLMGAAATYYAEEGQKYSARMKKAESEAADSLVASQSSQSHLDLHSVGVKDAVRITRERVTTWWHELGESKYTSLRHEYRVITGTGTHSVGGKPRIGPAVAKMLIREGWKVEMGTGVLTVTGVAKPV